MRSFDSGCAFDEKTQPGKKTIGYKIHLSMHIGDKGGR